MTDLFTIGEAAAASGVRADTIRYYEKVGLLAQPARTAGNYRTYRPEEVRRLGFIRRGRELGFPVEHVRELLELADHRQHDCCRVDQLTHEHLAQIDRKIEDLTALRRELAALVASCHGGTVEDCRILEALAPAGPA
jgi:Cu(I)-responsive transcriptional regulator